MSQKSNKKKTMVSANTMAATKLNSEWLNKIICELSGLINGVNS